MVIFVHIEINEIFINNFCINSLFRKVLDKEAEVILEMKLLLNQQTQLSIPKELIHSNLSKKKEKREKYFSFRLSSIPD